MFVHIMAAVVSIFIPITTTPAPAPVIGEPACHSDLPCPLYWQHIETEFWNRTNKSLTCDDSSMHDMPTVLRQEIVLDCAPIIDDPDVLESVRQYWAAIWQGDGCVNDIAHRDHMPELLASNLRERCYHYQGEDDVN